MAPELRMGFTFLKSCKKCVKRWKISNRDCLWPAKSNILPLWPLTSQTCCSLSHREALLSERHLGIFFSWRQPQLSVFRVLFLLSGSREGNLLISTNAVCLWAKSFGFPSYRIYYRFANDPNDLHWEGLFISAVSWNRQLTAHQQIRGQEHPKNRAVKSQLSLPSFRLLKYWHDFLHFHFINKDLVWEITESRVPRRPGRW